MRFKKLFQFFFLFINYIFIPRIIQICSKSNAILIGRLLCYFGSAYILTQIENKNNPKLLQIFFKIFEIIVIWTSTMLLSIEIQCMVAITAIFYKFLII